jgi:predicted DNA-binding transcriptional regulator AlpA
MTEEQAKRITTTLRGLREAKRTYDDLLFDLVEDFVTASIDNKYSSERRGVDKEATQINKRFVSRKELAQIVGLSVRTISDLQAAGLPTLKQTGRRVIFDLEDAVAWIKECGTKGRKKQGLRVVR